MSVAVESDLLDLGADTGSRFGAYRLLRLLGHGGMGDVWLAEWKAEGNAQLRVALKRILPHLCREPSIVRMFLSEAELALRLRHPNIVRALDAGQIAGRPYIALELLQGTDLRTLLRMNGAPLPLGFCLRVAHELCAALVYTHRLIDEDGRVLAVVHRDVSPSNVMLGFDGTIKLLDFGLAKSLNQRGTDATRTGVIKGKVGYMAPEILDGQPYDHRVDLFSVGVVLHELLTSRRLFTADEECQAIVLNLACRVEAPSAINPAVPREIDDIVLRALARDPAARYQSADEMAAALADALTRWPCSAQKTATLLQESPTQALAMPAIAMPQPLGTEGLTVPYAEPPAPRSWTSLAREVAPTLFASRVGLLPGARRRLACGAGVLLVLFALALARLMAHRSAPAAIAAPAAAVVAPERAIPERLSGDDSAPSANNLPLLQAEPLPVRSAHARPIVTPRPRLPTTTKALHSAPTVRIKRPARRKRSEVRIAVHLNGKNLLNPFGVREAE